MDAQANAAAALAKEDANKNQKKRSQDESLEEPEDKKQKPNEPESRRSVSTLLYPLEEAPAQGVEASSQKPTTAPAPAQEVEDEDRAHLAE